MNKQKSVNKKRYKPLYRNGCSLFLSFSWTFRRWMKYSEKGFKNKMFRKNCSNVENETIHLFL